MPQRSHKNTGWLPMFFLLLSDKISLISKAVFTALRRREHGRVTDAFLSTWISAFLCSPHIPGMRLPALMRAFTSTIAILETSPFAMSLLLWCLAFAWALKDLSLLIVCTTAYLYISCRTTACFFLSTTAVSRAIASELYILKPLRTS